MGVLTVVRSGVGTRCGRHGRVSVFMKGLSVTALVWSAVKAAITATSRVINAVCGNGGSGVVAAKNRASSVASGGEAISKNRRKATCCLKVYTGRFRANGPILMHVCFRAVPSGSRYGDCPSVNHAGKAVLVSSSLVVTCGRAMFNAIC